MLLVSFSGHTPFYRIWYAVMPLMNKVRAAGMAFFIPAFVVCALGGIGIDAVFARRLTQKQLFTPVVVLTILAVLGVLGVLQAIAEMIAIPELMPRVVANAAALRLGSLRLLAVTLIGGGLLWAIWSQRFGGIRAWSALVIVITADSWSITSNFFHFQPPASQSYRDDEITGYLKQAKLPYRLWNPAGVYGGLQVYPQSWLMAYRIPVLLGYHGNELRYFDEVLGTKNEWNNQVNSGLWDLFAVRFILLRDPQDIPGYTRIMGPTRTALGGTGYLYEADSIPPYVRLMSGAIKAPAPDVLQAATDPRFPVTEVALYDETVPFNPDTVGAIVPTPPLARAVLEEWRPGFMKISVVGQDPRITYLVVAENWYPDWKARIDGQDVEVLKAQHTLLSVRVPPGARTVEFEYSAAHHARFRGVSFVAGVAAILLILVPGHRERRRGTSA